MAVYTEVPAEALEAFLSRYETGALVSAKGIAEGVSNSNFLIETETARYILTLYERRIDLADLPWFIALMEHLADAGQPVPRPIRDRSGAAIQHTPWCTTPNLAYGTAAKRSPQLPEASNREVTAASTVTIETMSDSGSIGPVSFNSDDRAQNQSILL